MEIKRNRGQVRRPGWIAAPLLAFLVAFGMIMMMPGLSGEAGAVDFDKACSLTVQPGNEDLAADLEKAKVVVDLYQVAKAEPVSGYDTTWVQGTVKTLADTWVQGVARALCTSIFLNQ